MGQHRGKAQYYWLLRVPGGTRYWDSGKTATEAATECLGAPYEALYVKKLRWHDLISEVRLTRAINDRSGWTTFQKNPDGTFTEVPNQERPPGETTAAQGQLFPRGFHNHSKNPEYMKRCT